MREPRSFPKISQLRVQLLSIHFTTTMEISLQQRQLRLSYFSIILLAFSFLVPTQALYFYLDGTSANPKCFYEELPKDTMVVGEQPQPLPS